jgi:hypothetical protein
MNFKQMSFVTSRPDVHSIRIKLTLSITKHHDMKMYTVCFIKYHNMKTYWGGVYIHIFLIWALHGGE